MKARAFALIACLLAVSESALSSAPEDTIYARPGLLVAASGARLNIYCMGRGSPAVVFDSGWEDWAPAWAVVQPRVARFARACSYDRAGAGFSDAGPMPRTTVRIADELLDALHNARIGGPYILVGHAFGADNIRAFADRHSADVAGLVFVDGDAVDYEPADMQAIDHRGQATLIAQLRTCHDAVANRKSLPPLRGRHGRVLRSCAQQFFRGLPEAAWSPELNAALLHIAQTKVAMYDAYISEMEQMPWDEAYLKAHRRSLGSRPVIVISTGNHGVGSLTRARPPSLAHLRYEYETNLAQWHLLELSSNSKQVYADHSSEYVVFDEPNAVVTAIREVYDASAGKRSSSTTFPDCRVCPEMVLMPTGTLTMGSSRAEKSWAASLGAIVPARRPLYLPAVADESP
jgi:pimeloyl-ACP methyl ester carboxylesterase